MGIRWIRWAVFGMLLMLLTGCAGNTEKVEEPWLVIGGSPVYRDEIMIYLYQTHNDFEAYGGTDVWLIEDFSGGRSAGEVAKQAALENIIKNRILSAKADELGVSHPEGMKASLEEEAGDYYSQLPASFVASNGIEESTVLKVIGDNHLNFEVTEHTMENYTPNVAEVMERVNSNEEYRRISEIPASEVLTMYRVQHLLINTHIKDDDGNYQPVSDAAQKMAEEKIYAVHKALAEGASVDEVVASEPALSYHWEQPDGILLNSAQLPRNYDDALVDLAPGDMTDVIEGRVGYHIFYLEEKQIPSEEEIEAYEVRFLEWKEALIQDAEKTLTREAFDSIYSGWRESTDISYSQQWMALDFDEMLPTFEGQVNE